MILAEHIDHICLKPDATMSDIEKLCVEAVEYNVAGVCVPPLFVKIAKAFTAGSNIKCVAAIGFPYGFSAIEAKVAEIVLAIIDGADELEIVINTGAVKNKDWKFLASEVNTIMPVIRNKDKKITIVLETGLLTDTEIITACDVYGAAGVDFIKAGTGIIENVKVAEQVALIRKHLAETVKIKVATAVKSYNDAQILFTSGANRLSCNNSLILLQEAL